MEKNNENQVKMSCGDQLKNIRDLYSVIHSQILNELNMSTSTYNYKVRTNTFSVAETNMIIPIIKKQTECFTKM
jgi:hypothetical protein